METQYYNLIPPLAKSEDLGPLSPGSDDSGVQEEQPAKQPQRPPRSIDTPEKILPKHSYINLTGSSRPAPLLSANLVLQQQKQAEGTIQVKECRSPAPSLPKRQPYLVQSPQLTHRLTHQLQRSASSATVVTRSYKQQHRSNKASCKCKGSLSGKLQFTVPKKPKSS